MQITATSFKAYDIRGIVPAALNEAFAHGLGRAFGMAALDRKSTRLNSSHPSISRMPSSA